MTDPEILEWGNMLVGAHMDVPLAFWRIDGLEQWYPRLGIGADPTETLADLDALSGCSET